MILTVDIGNTTANFCAVEKENGEYKVRSSFFYPSHGTSFPFLQDMDLEASDFEGAVLTSVVRERTDAFAELITHNLGKRPLIVSHTLNTGLSLDVKQPDRLGTDRIVDAVSASEKYPLPAITVDAGTAVTFNVISKDRVFLGGAIAPGLETSMKALETRTSQLQASLLEEPQHVIGKDTGECMQSGVIAGTASLIDGMCTRFTEELEEPATVILTGGGASFLHPLLRTDHVWDPDLLIRGLAILYERNS